MRIRLNPLLRAATAALCLAISAAPAFAQTTRQREARGDAVVRSLNGGASQPVLERMRSEFPFLAEATEAYALGDVWSRRILDDRTRQLAAVAAFAALGEPAFLKVHASYALNIGVTEEQLKEIVYLTTVTAGFPKAIAASQALSELFGERRAARAEGPLP
jgi:4-carboxymuconolactone decarboxylase